MAELAHVPRPRIGEHQVARRRADLAHHLPVLGVERSQEMLGQEQHVLVALPQGRYVEHDHRQAEIEILAEPLLARLALEIAVRGGDDAEVDLALAHTATRRTARSSMARSNFPCSERSTSPSSSRNRNPP